MSNYRAEIVLDRREHSEDQHRILPALYRARILQCIAGSKQSPVVAKTSDVLIIHGYAYCKSCFSSTIVAWIATASIHRLPARPDVESLVNKGYHL